MQDETSSTLVSSTDEHPNPQMRRACWHSLNGSWDFSIDAQGLIEEPENVSWDQKIIVPFSPETKASGIANTGFYSAVWYRRSFVIPDQTPGKRVLLHFEAVDHRTTVWVNGAKVLVHEGGYTPFSADITFALKEAGSPQEIVVRAEDDPTDLAKPRGKQDWRLEPHSIWYPRTTGIWQTVWIECVSPVRIESLLWTSDVTRWEIGFNTKIEGGVGRALTVALKLMREHIVLATDTYEVIAGEVHRSISLSDPGIDDYRNDLLWSPRSPTLIDACIELRDEDGKVIDEVHSYTALRTVNVQGDKFILNGRPIILRLVLDQGYWPETGATSPNDQALLHDVLLAKVMGFNGVRKHQKIECQRYLYWADRMGLLVWEEMPSAYRFTRESIERLTREWVDGDQPRQQPPLHHRLGTLQ